MELLHVLQEEWDFTYLVCTESSSNSISQQQKCYQKPFVQYEEEVGENGFNSKGFLFLPRLRQYV